MRRPIAPAIRCFPTDTKGAGYIVDEKRKKIIYCVIGCLFLLCIISTGFFFYRLGIRDGAGGGGSSIADTERSVDEAAERAANRLDDASGEIERAEETGGDLSRTISDSSEAVRKGAGAASNVATELDDVQKVLDRCQGRNREIAEIISGASGSAPGPAGTKQSAEEK